MKVITVGRSSSNDVNINDPMVSRIHCQIIQDDNEQYWLVDTNSKNGTFVNGIKRHGKIQLNESDIIRIGNTTLPWRNYCLPIPIEHYPAPDPVGPSSSPKSKGLGTIALLISIIAAVLSVISIVKFAQWGLFAILGNAPILFWVSIGMHVIALVTASIADYNNYEDTDMADIADWISGFCLGVIGILVIIGLVQN